ncbi:MAG: type II toxin-antitoxin system RelE/ParE family toxin [Planctomycetes bacterium]|nr:type II toxin-antitoxin system RelE/ParE family toxin [Planctomycetota bacterium]
MTFRPKFRPRAWLDLDEICRYYEEQSPGLAARFMNAVRESAQFLSENPTLGQVWQGHRQAPSEYRIWQVRGFPRLIIFFVSQGSTIEVMRVLHAARDLESLFDD